MRLEQHEAVILDCDGVIVDSEPYSCGAWNVVFEREFGLDVGTDYTEILGKNSRDTVIHYLTRFNIPVQEELISKLSALKEQVYFELAEGQLSPIDDVQDFVTFCKERNLKLAVASSGSREKILFNLEQVHLLPYFDVIVGTDGTIRGKPHPDVFLEAARQLGVSPSKCVVIEDTPNGIVAAKSAGMFTIALTTTFPAKQLDDADLVISSFKALMNYLSTSG